MCLHFPSQLQNFVHLSVVEASIEIRKRHKTKLPDAIIAATALVYGLVLISRNVSDFKSIDGLQVIDPHLL
ncbi:PIN domain-containing protein [Runella sp. SP2]|uniref:PIN domain-containing protein n=1 Tax=Runella sp. SP2 TaxID=2268026 RepID=UPI000F09A281|nr:PIN domain-containing protein [Runella sp. SP2]